MSARRGRGWVTAAAVAVLGALMAFGGGGPAGAATEPAGAATEPAGAATEPPTPSPTEKPTLQIEITEVSPEVLRPGEDLTVLATLHNTTDEVVDNPGAVLRIKRVRPGSLPELESWADGSTSSAGQRDATATVGSPLAPGASASVVLSVAADRIGLRTLADVWGPRGIAVDATSGNRVTDQQRSFVLWLPSDDVPTVPVSLLVPVTGPPLAPALPAGPDESDSTAAPGSEPSTAPTAADPATVQRLEAATAPGGRLTALESALSSHPDIGVVVDPALLAAAAAGGPQAREWAETMTSTLGSRDVWALPWADPDIAAAAHADRADLVTLAARTGTEISTLPVDGTLLWAPPGPGPDRSTAAVTGAANARALVIGPDSGLSEERVSGADGARQRVGTTTGTATALVGDTTLTDLLVDPDAVEPGSTTATAVQRALAELAVLARSGDGAPPALLLSPGRSWTPDDARLDALLGAFAAAPWVQVRSAATLLEGEDDAHGTLPATAHDADELAPAGVQALGAARERALGFATVTTDPQSLLDGVDTEILAPLSVAWREDPAARDALVAATVTSVDARTTGLSLGAQGDITVISASSEVRLSVRNDLAVPATVLVDVQPRKACLEVGEPEPVTVAPNSEKSVPVHLVANANCDVVVVAQLTSTEGAPVSPPLQFTARVSPTIENVGTIVVGVLLAIGLILGIVRTVRRGQSARRGARTEAEGTGPLSLPVLGGSLDDPTPKDPS
ncbi:hypothetical protein Cch01nite_14230 [Cellulomonas chitinilytica]|uniref:Glycoprotein n=1 Tax=Cellulomonas chitinilytica TaxID=398759 RepID=A0A919P435_9CELL|nr:DUF6049 family protein [Cellulomonas chitinilytica]GIG20699.1 hypothetical protein Cch01nite_14230 [Cellulomonas chitinilytica]